MGRDSFDAVLCCALPLGHEYPASGAPRATGRQEATFIVPTRTPWLYTQSFSMFSSEQLIWLDRHAPMKCCKSAISEMRNWLHAACNDDADGHVLRRGRGPRRDGVTLWRLLSRERACMMLCPGSRTPANSYHATKCSPQTDGRPQIPGAWGASASGHFTATAWAVGCTVAPASPPRPSSA